VCLFMRMLSFSDRERIFYLEGFTLQLPINAQRLYITKFDENMAESVHITSLDEDNRRFVPDEVFETIEAASETISSIISWYVEKDAPPQSFIWRGLLRA